MIIYQVEIHVSGMMDKAPINHELGVIDQMLALVGGGLFCAERTADPSRINLFLRAKSEAIIADIIEATDFAVRHIHPMGTPYEAYISFHGWRALEVRAKQKPKNYLIDFNPLHQFIARQSPARKKPAKHLAPSGRFALHAEAHGHLGTSTQEKQP